MALLHKILTIAKYERKVLLRSWFFNIFSVISLLLLFLMNLVFIIKGGGDTGWAIRSIPAAIPYSNLLVLNVTQAICAVFLASDFLKRDKNIDTNEVIYTRSLTNGEYIIGKTWGNLQVFLLLNIAVLIMALIFNLLSPETTINWPAYVIYPVLISLPTLVFIMGLSYLLMTIIRNQAITFIIIFGYISITLFLLQNAYYHVFDYMSFKIPMVISDIAGMGNFKRVLIHRGIYFSFGISFIFFTIVIFNRLQQSKIIIFISLVFAIIFFMVGCFLGYQHIARFKFDENLRREAITLNNSYVNELLPATLSHSISLKHREDSLEVVSKISIENDKDKSLQKFIFCLNRGLDLISFKINGQQTPFIREHHLIIVNQGVDIQPGEKADVEIAYAGIIDETLAYLDILEEERQKKYGKFVLNVDKRHAFLTSNYVLLTPEVNWYPKTGVTYSTEDMSWNHPEFIDFKLEVKTQPGLQAVSQGKITEIAAGYFTFNPDVPLTQLSLAIGKYERKAVKIDSMEYGIWHIEGHDFFSHAFPETKDTVVQLVNERKIDFENTYNLEYAFNRFFLVEVPAQFKSYERIWTNRQEFVQPEQVLIPEKGYLLVEADFKSKKKQWNRANNKMTDKDIEVRLLFDFIEVFRREETLEFFTGLYPNPYFIFPMLYNFQNNIYSDKWPVVYRIFETWLKSQSTKNRENFNLDNQGMSEDDLANIALQDNTFEEILKDPKQKRIIENVIQLKGEFLFSMIQRETGQKNFEDFLHELLRLYRFKNFSFEQFDQKINEQFGIELIPMMDNWLNEKSLPAYLLSPFKAVKVKSGNRMMTKVSFKVTNSSDTEGIIKLSFRLTGGGGAGKLVYLEPNQTKDVSLMLSADPQVVKVNTMASKNIPRIIYERFSTIVEDPNTAPFEGEVVSETPVTKQRPVEIIVDNEHPGFEIDVSDEGMLLQKWLKREEKKEIQKYSTISYWWPSTTWTTVINSGFFGEHVLSAYYIKSGDGSLKARWQVPIAEPGYYDIQYHLYKPNNLKYGSGQYNFTIQDENGTEELGLSVQNAEEGWNHLGSFYFSHDTVLVELSNKSDINIIFADAIKFIEL